MMITRDLTWRPMVSLSAAFSFCSSLHPLQPEREIQGALELLWRLEEALKAITGMAAVTLQPAAGAHGELAGILMIRKALEALGYAQ